VSKRDRKKGRVPLHRGTNLLNAANSFGEKERGEAGERERKEKHLM